MLDLKKFFTDFENLQQQLGYRGVDQQLLLTIKAKLSQKKQLEETINQARHQRRILSKQQQFSSVQVKQLRDEINQQEELLAQLIVEINTLTSSLPNLPATDTPHKVNRLVKEVVYDHSLDHQYRGEEIIQQLAMIDENGGIKLSGSKFVVYRGQGSELVRGLINFMLATNKKSGYQLVEVPYMVKANNPYQVGQLPKFDGGLYKIANEDFYLVPTAETSLINLYQGEIIPVDQLPINVSAYSPCFRSETGSAGQENKGLIRLHQFHKIELVKLVTAEEAVAANWQLVEDAAKILEQLQITYRVVELCHQELGFAAQKTFDIEMWLPISQKWLEISSCSNCGDFQSRRANIKVKRVNGKKELVHTLNGSALAVDRLVLALCEYYYRADSNSLELPTILTKYFL